MRGQLIESVVHRQKLVILNRRDDFHLVDIQTFLPAAVPRRAFVAGAIDENATHRLRGRAEEVGAILPALILPTDPNPRFMDERRRLQRLSRRLARHLLRSDPAQLCVNERKKLIRSDVLLAAGDPIKKQGKIVHGGRVPGPPPPTNQTRAVERSRACTVPKRGTELPSRKRGSVDVKAFAPPHG